MNNNLLDALKSIDVASLSRADWLAVGMALKEEGYDCSVWDEWSKADKRYKPGECEAKWKGFGGSAHPVTGATIMQFAKDRGYAPTPFGGKSMIMEWDDVIEYDGDGVVYEVKIQSPAKQIETYLKTLFKEDEIVGYVTNDVWQDRSDPSKWMPSKGVYNRTCGELLKLLEKHGDDIGATFGDPKECCGAWIRFNPLDGKGVANDNVTRFDYALVECDDLPTQDQEAFLRRYELPIAALVHSGGKSIHAIVRVDAPDYEEYRKRVDFLYEFLDKHGYSVDKQNRNPSRLSRMPGVNRNGNKQYLIATNIGRKSWVDWLDFVEGIDDEMPEFTYLNDALKDLPPLPEELICGVLRKGHKMIISGSSKAGKSFLLMELAICLASGKPWLGFNVKKTKVLYVNLEIDGASCLHRFKDIIDSFGIDEKCAENITIWNLRGRALGISKLVPKIVRRIKDQQYGCIILDPIYKMMEGDENSASDMGAFCNQFDKICNETGCSTIYCHHHAKGNAQTKVVIDRSSGSGVFARDPDAIIDLTQLELDPAFVLKNAVNEFSTAWRVEGSLREFANFKPVDIWFNYPIHVVDTAGAIRKHLTMPSVKESKGGVVKVDDEDLDFAFNTASKDGKTANAKEMAESLDVTTKTIKRACSRTNKYVDEDGVVTKVVDDDEK